MGFKPAVQLPVHTLPNHWTKLFNNLDLKMFAPKDRFDFQSMLASSFA